MSGPNQNKPGGKKSAKRSRKPDQPQNQRPEQLESQRPEQLLSQQPEQLLSQQPEQLLNQKPEQLLSQKPDQVASQRPEPLLSGQPDQLKSPKPEPQQPSPKQADATVVSAQAASIDFQTLATAYGNYTKKSFEQTKAFVEKLSGVRSLDKAVEIQTEFAKQAYETFVSESQKIRELYSGLATQNLKPFAGLTAKKTRATH
jgi:Phasin protein